MNRSLVGSLFSQQEGKGASKRKFKNRSRIEIFSTIINKARNGALKTHLMYGANLSYPMLGEYLDILLRSGLLSEENDGNNSLKQYRTTPKGFEFLRIYQELKEMLGEQHLTGEQPQTPRYVDPLISESPEAPLFVEAMTHFE